LVYLNFRDSYLIDCCFLVISEASNFLKALNERFCLETNILRAVELGNDIIIVNYSLIRDKKVTFHPFIIDINGNKRLDQTETEQTRLLLNECVAFTESAYQLNYSDSFNTNIGFPLLAGWLLGYPCIYRSIATESNSNGSESLSMTILQKFSITALCSLNPVDLKFENIDLLEFTIPLHHLEESHEFCCEINKQLNEKLMRYQTQSNNLDKIFVVKNIQLNCELFTVSAINL
jgi:hypothetical protein